MVLGGGPDLHQRDLGDLSLGDDSGQATDARFGKHGAANTAYDLALYTHCGAGAIDFERHFL